MVVRLWTNSLCLVLVCLSENSKVAFKATSYTEELVFFCAVSNRAVLWQQLHISFVHQLGIIFQKKMLLLVILEIVWLYRVL